jgi:hypothetical protein
MKMDQGQSTLIDSGGLMKDFAGNELEVGMKVVIIVPSYSHLVWAEIVKINPKTATCKYTKWKNYTATVARTPEQIIYPMSPELQDRLGAEWLRANLTS